MSNHVSELASSASEKVGKRIEFTPADVFANAGYCKAGYGVLTELEREAIRLFAKHEGLLLDPVYTGRAAAGMIDLIRKGFFKKDETCCSCTPADSQRCSQMNTRTRSSEEMGRTRPDLCPFPRIVDERISQSSFTPAMIPPTTPPTMPPIGFQPLIRRPPKAQPATPSRMLRIGCCDALAAGQDPAATTRRCRRRNGIVGNHADDG